jgi:hypothetical protein
LSVLVDESVAGGVSSDRLAGPIRDDAPIVGSALTETAVRSTGVVVRDVFAEEVLEVWAVPDESAVEEFVAHRTHPSFRVRVRDGRVGRGADDCRAVASEDLVEAVMNWPAPSRIRNLWVPKTRPGILNRGFARRDRNRRDAL